MGYALWDLEVTGGSSPIIRVTLEAVTDAKEIGIEDCAKVHQHLGPMFDVWDPIEGAYTLEISSPGEKASLRLFRHFEMAKGGKVKFQSIEPLPMPPPAKPRRNWEGTLTNLDPTEGIVEIEDDLGTYKIKFSQIRSAQWLRDWTLPIAKNLKRKD